MLQIVISEDQRNQMSGLETQEVRAGSGELIGYLVSPERYASLLRIWEEWEDAEMKELDRIAGEETCTLVEIWKELGVTQ